MKKYDKFIQFDTDFQPIQNMETTQKLPPGVYEVNSSPNVPLYFSKIKTEHDALIDLPHTEYDVVVKEIEMFMNPNTRKLFNEYGFLYKRSTLLEGPPGSGKTCIVNRVIKKVIEEGGVVLFSPNPKLLEEAFRAIDAIQPDTRIMVVFEELDQLILNFESSLLNLLDGEIQKPNVIYMATTNYIHKIPARIRRPGRFSSVIHVGFPSAETRLFYLQSKLGDSAILDEWVDKTEGFSIDELKETVLAVKCLNYDLGPIINRIKANKTESDYQTTNKKSSKYRDDGRYNDEHYDDDKGYDEDEDRPAAAYQIALTNLLK